MATQSTLSWIEIDLDELDAQTKELYANYKACYAAMKSARKAFEESAAIDLGTPAGKEWKFGYNYGKLSAALAPVEVKAVKKPRMSLEQYLAQHS